jgi:quinoprotein glucose dehydrogenase
MLYVKTSNNGALARLIQPKRSAENDADYAMDPSSPTVFHDRLPLLKPPYGYLTAVNLNTGEVAWHEVFGDTPQIGNHPALKGIRLPEKLGVAAAQGVIVTKGGLVFAGCGDAAFHAIDKATGHERWTFPLPRRVTATPMTYRAKDGRQYVVVATGS